MRFSDEEISQLIKSWAAISLAFTIAGVVQYGGSIQFGGGLGIFLQRYSIAALTVGIAFLLHELAHKYVAQRFGCWAEFRSFDTGLLLAVLMSFTGFIFAAPGAVLVGGIVSTSENGKISAAGPITNIFLSFLFLLLYTFIPLKGYLFWLVISGISINAWLAVFNLIPVWNLDGSKILRWDIRVWAVLMALGLLLLFRPF